MDGGIRERRWMLGKRSTKKKGLINIRSDEKEG